MKTVSIATANHSTGPKTAEGKRRSSLNATRHGLTGRVVVLPSEDLTIYVQFSKELIDSLKPETALEREIAQTIADGYWRLKRIRTIEDGLLALGYQDGQDDFDADHENIHSTITNARSFSKQSNAFANISIYEQRIHRAIEKSTKQLQDLQAARKAQRQEELREVVRLRNFNNMQKLPYDPAEDGFVYSPTEIEAEAHRQDRLKKAQIAERFNFHKASYARQVA